MKFTKQAILLLALCCTATWANPLLGGIFGSVGKIGDGIIGGVIGGIRGGVNGAHKGAGDALNGAGPGKDAANAAADSVPDGVKGGLDAENNAANDKLDGAEQLDGDIQKGISGSIAGKVTSGVKRLALKKTLIKLEAIKAASNALIEGLLTLGSELEAIHEKHIADLQDKHNSWAEEQLERVHVATDGAADDEADELVNELKNRYDNYINACVGEIDQKKADFDDQVDKTVENYKQGLDGVQNQVEECLKSDNSFKSSKRCATELPKSLLPLAKIPKDLFDLKKSGDKLLINGLIHSACMATTLAELELEKSNLAGQLDQLIEEHNNADSSTESEAA